MRYMQQYTNEDHKLKVMQLNGHIKEDLKMGECI